MRPASTEHVARVFNAALHVGWWALLVAGAGMVWSVPAMRRAQSMSSSSPVPQLRKLEPPTIAYGRSDFQFERANLPSVCVQWRHRLYRGNRLLR
jgi:hypothetical protein